MEESLQKPQNTENNEIYTKEYERAKTRLLDIFRNKDEQEIEELCLEIKKFAEVLGWDFLAVIEEVKEAFKQENPEVFVSIAFNALKKLIDQKIEHPEIFEDIRRERVFQRSGNIQLSELMYYDVDLQNGIARIHIAPKGNLGLSVIIRSFREGLSELAKQVKRDERIREIQATSWIVASNPGLLEKAGFKVEGPITEEIKAAHFSDEEKPVSWAHMSRETLLEKYLL